MLKATTPRPRHPDANATPPPFSGALAFLPFQLACFPDDRGDLHFIVASVMSAKPAGGFGHRFFGPGAILVMHVGANPSDHTTLDADALGTIIERVRRRGYRLVTLPAAYAALYPSWAARR